MRPGRTAALLLALGLMLLLATAVRVAVSGHRELARGRDLLAAGQTEEGVAALGRAARWYLPALGAHREALETLMAVASARETGGDTAGALTAFRHVRGAILGSRWLLTPDADLLTTANDRIAFLMATQDRALRGETALDAAAHRAFLERDAVPDAGRSALAVGLFLAWVGAAAIGLWRGLQPDGGVRGRVLAPWSALSLLLLVAWVFVLAGL